MPADATPLQLDLCEPYLAPHADYRLFEQSDSAPRDWRDLAVLEPFLRTHDYAHAVAMAREHCLLEGLPVCVVDFNDHGSVVFRVDPAEYTARALGLRYPGV